MKILKSLTIFGLLIIIISLFIVICFRFYYPIKTWKLPSASKAIAFSSDDTMLAIGSGKAKSYKITSIHSIGGQSSMVEIRSISNDSVIQTLNFPAATSLAFSPDGKLIASAEKDGTIRFWKVPSRNYSWLWLLGTGGLATIIYWQRKEIITWLNK